LKVLIDGDIFRYRCAWAAERSYYLVELVNSNGHREYKQYDTKKEADGFGERATASAPGAFFRIWSRKDLQPWENCAQIVNSSIQNTLDAITSHFNVQEVEYSIWLSGKTNFRDNIATTKAYKGNRDESPKPSYYKDVGAHLVAHWGATYTDGIEADDALGISAMEAKSAGKDYVIVSNDKDLRQIPGLHYDWIKKEFYTVSPKDAKFQLFSQILSGDATDNVPGLGGIGPATAAKILEGAQSPEEMVDRVVEQYKKQQMDHPSEPHHYTEWRKYLKEQWALVYILKHSKENVWDSKEGKYFLEKYGTTKHA
jgi:hypothetical protein